MPKFLISAEFRRSSVSCTVTVYVDDTVLLFASKSIAEIELKLNCDLNRIRNWMQTNQITKPRSKPYSVYSTLLSEHHYREKVL